MPFVFFKQLNGMDCGSTCLRMVARHYGKHYNADTLRQLSGFSRSGTSMWGISESAQKIGFRTRAVRIPYSILDEIPLPAILHWNQNHFVVLIDISKNKVKIADPATGIITCHKEEFLQYWLSSKNDKDEETGLALLLEPAPAFYETQGESKRTLSWSFAFQYLRHGRAHLIQIFIALLINFLLTLIVPFLTQSIVDVGINTRNMQYITVVLLAQLMLTFSHTIIGFISSKLQLRISNILNISILSDFWIKLTSLPVSYFDNHRTGDILQRLGDNRLIQNYITNVAMNTIFTLVNFFVYSTILMIYSPRLFLIFMAGNALYFAWIWLFMRIRRKLNYETFHLAAKENTATLQLVQGMQEIKLNNAEQQKRWEWENIQARIFRLSIKGLNYTQWQSLGALAITQGKDILISFFIARLVVQGQLTLGAMLALTYIIGQLTGPINEFIGLIHSTQDARISLERLNDVHGLEDEEPATKSFVNDIKGCKSIQLHNVKFTYPNSSGSVLKNISLTIPEGKVTAIVGVSGSGKTTLLKILMKAYHTYEGQIRIDTTDFNHISPSCWRKNCGVVLQDGYIFNDTIARNICVNDENIDMPRLIQCCKIANITSYIESLPNGINTQLGADGTGLSQGQRQRILIARAIYKRPDYLFLDEATNALDANNEKLIVKNLSEVFVNKTVIVVAHRLSTVKNAEKIVVLKDGEIVEEGSHAQLTAIRGQYFELVKNQLELGA